MFIKCTGPEIKFSEHGSRKNDTKIEDFPILTKYTPTYVRIIAKEKPFLGEILFFIPDSKITNLRTQLLGAGNP